MKLKQFFLSALLASVSCLSMAMDPDEIISTYHENIGGKEALLKIKGMKMLGDFQQGAMKFPMEIVVMADGRQYSKISVQGKEIKQGVFDGNVLWSTNFLTMKAEKSSADDTHNMKLNANDFPDAFLNYKKKGYTVEFVGKDTIDGAEVLKLRLTKEPMLIEGKTVPDVSYYYFDSESMIPLLVENELQQGEGKGLIQQIKFSDYQEVSGIYFPFTMTQGIKGKGEAPITFSKIDINPTVNDADFSFPVTK